MSAAQRRERKQKANLEQTKVKLDNFLKEGKYYEAQQLYRTLYNRYAARNNLQMAIELVLDGTINLLEHKQGNAAGDLALLLIEGYERLDTPATKSEVGNLQKIGVGFPDNDCHEATTTFYKTAIRYVEAKGGQDMASLLHLDLARRYKNNENFAMSQRHYLRAREPVEHSKMLLIWAGRGNRREQDLFLARSVLQYLCLEDLGSANTLYKTFTATKTLDTPLINFLEFLLLTLERDARPLFLTLRQKYQTELSRDPQFNHYLNKIGQAFYNIQPPKGLMENLMGMFQ